MVPEQTRKKCFEYGERPSAAEQAERYIMHGLEQIDNISGIDAIGSVRAKVWPAGKMISISNSVEQTSKGTIYGRGYVNIPFVNFIHRERSIVKSARLWAKNNKDEKDVVVIVYSMHSPFMKAVKIIKQIIPSAKTCLIVADLPLFMNMQGIVRKQLKILDWERIQGLMRYFDKYLLYTKYMADYLNLEKNTWMVFEGLIDENKIIEKPYKNKSIHKVVLYAGNLNAQYGIDTLIDAFKMIKDNCRLHIYGSGFDVDRIKNITENIENVEYKGQVSQEEVFTIMKESTLLVNPRPSDIGLAKFSCPSKTFEYMASGTPVLMNKLPGLPEEYYPYIGFFEEETPEGYAEKIKEYLSKDENDLNEIGMKAADFLKKEKTSLRVMERVMKFVCS